MDFVQYREQPNNLTQSELHESRECCFLGLLSRLWHLTASLSQIFLGLSRQTQLCLQQTILSTCSLLVLEGVYFHNTTEYTTIVIQLSRDIQGMYTTHSLRLLSDKQNKAH